MDKCSNLARQFVSKLKEEKGALVVWVDYMKLGRLTSQDLNSTVDLLKRALDAHPEKACGLLIAPQLQSDRRSGLRAEWRHVSNLYKFARVGTLVGTPKMKLVCDKP